MKKNYRGVFYLLASIIILMLLAGLFFFTPKMETITYTQFVELAEKGEIRAVYIKSYTMVVHRADSDIAEKDFPKKADYSLTIPSRLAVDELIEKVYNAQLEAATTEEEKLAVTRIVADYSDPNAPTIWTYIMPILIIVSLCVVGFVIFRMLSGSNKQAINFGRSKARLHEQVKVRFNDVAGAEEEKQELEEIVEFLKSPQKFSAVGARIPKGVLLVGQPGTGKTLFAKAIAGEANVPFFSISGSDFVEMYVGVGASRVRDLFEQAKRSMPCIVFIDEIDAVGRQRGTGLGGGHDEREQTLNQLLVEMDGFGTNEGIIIMAATNRADILDPALLRPGRFDRQIYVHVPDVRGREAIFKVHARNKPLDKDVDFATLARITAGFTGADIENLLNEAAILCARDGRKLISMKDINEGINKTLLGPQKKSRLITEYDKRVTAFHEAGHAVVAYVLPDADPVHEVSIIPRGMAGGYTMMRPDNDDSHTSFKNLTAMIAVSMGGRSAEEIFIGNIHTGAESDIKKSTEIARKMVCEWGMSDIGPVYLGGGNAQVFLGRDINSEMTYSEKISAQVDDAINQIVNDGHKQACDILNKHSEAVQKMARVLIEKETIYADEVKMIMDGCSIEEIYEAIEQKLKSRRVPYQNNDSVAH